MCVCVCVCLHLYVCFLVSSHTVCTSPLFSSFLQLQAMEQPSPLADGCHQFFDTQELSDMVIVLVSPKTPSEDAPNFLLSPSKAQSLSDQGGVEIPAHRVVLAARSEWFQRALQSGMKEAIDRRIVVQDIEESLFRLFLSFLYGSHLDFGIMSQQEVVELLAVADRYEVCACVRVFVHVCVCT